MRERGPREVPLGSLDTCVLATPYDGLLLLVDSHYLVDGKSRLGFIVEHNPQDVTLVVIEHDTLHVSLCMEVALLVVNNRVRGNDSEECHWWLICQGWSQGAKEHQKDSDEKVLHVTS